jgi:hypothetical protein
MEKRKIYVVALLLAIILVLFGKMYLFNVYEVEYTIQPKGLYADNQSMLEIRAVPVNAFGWRAPFRSSPAEFEIREGSVLVDIIKMDKENGVLVIKAKDKPGKVSVYVSSKYSLLPSVFDINIEPNAA